MTYTVPVGCPPVLREAYREPRGAIIDGRERHLLWRRWDDPEESPYAPLVVIGLNPSTADGTADDPTIRSIVRLATQNGYTGIWMLNLDPRRATIPEVLYRWIEDGDPANLSRADQVAQLAIRHAGAVACAWGAMSAASDRVREHLLSRAARLIRMADNEARPILRWTITKQGHPGHPLYLPSTSRLSAWNGALTYGIP